MSVTAHDMGEFWRLIEVHVNGPGRVHGTFWASGRDGTAGHIKSIDVLVWSDEARSAGGIFLRSGDLTAFVEPNGIKLPKHTIASDRLAAVEDAWDDMIAALEAVVAEYERVMDGVQR